MAPSSMRIEAYSCSVGHAIPADRLEELTEVVELDTGAEVRICAEHGAPIVLTLSPVDESQDGSAP